MKTELQSPKVVAVTLGNLMMMIEGRSIIIMMVGIKIGEMVEEVILGSAITSKRSVTMVVRMIIEVLIEDQGLEIEKKLELLVVEMMNFLLKRRKLK